MTGGEGACETVTYRRVGTAVRHLGASPAELRGRAFWDCQTDA
jgi:hypothetical protein